MNLNVGSGQRRFGKGWVNVDLQVRSPEQIPDVQAHGERLPFPHDSADFVVLHHVLEHYGCGEGMALLKECWKILKPGGSLLIFVPDVRQLAKRFLIRGISDQIYLTNIYGAYQGNEADRHKWGFTSESLRNFIGLAIAPGSGMHFYDWREIPGADIAQDWWILSMECIKGHPSN